MGCSWKMVRCAKSSGVLEMKTPLVIIIFLSGCLVGVLGGAYLGKQEIRIQSIESGCGQYNPKTGNFEWTQ